MFIHGVGKGVETRRRIAIAHQLKISAQLVERFGIQKTI